MKFKLIALSALISFSLSVLKGQERVNRQKLSFDTSSGVMTKSTGWAYNSTLGEWIDYDNVISARKDYKDRSKILQGSYMMSKTDQNFLGVQTKTMKFRDTTYYVLIVEKWEGEYEYPSIKEDWYEFKITYGYLFTKEEYQKILNLDSGTLSIKSKFKVSMGSKYERYDETKFLDLIQSEILKGRDKWNSDYLFTISKSSKKLVRFYVPYVDRNYTYSFSKYDFKESYFETDSENFNKVLLPTK